MAVVVLATVVGKGAVAATSAAVVIAALAATVLAMAVGLWQRW